MKEEPVGVVIHYFPRAGVAAIRLDNGSLHLGDKIHIVGNATDIEETVGSMEIDQKKIVDAATGDNIGIKIEGHVRERDQVFKVVSD